MATSTDLIQDVYNNFLGKYARGTDAGNTVIFFEAAGLSPGLDPGAPGAKAAALEYISNEADWLPDLTGAVYQRTMRTISGNYTGLLSSSVPVAESGATVFNAMKAAAVEALQNAKLGSLNGPSQYLPAYATPQDWFDAAQVNNWSNYSYQVASAPPPAGGPVNPPQRKWPPIRLPVWRMMSAVPTPPASVAVAPSVPYVPLASVAGGEKLAVDRMTLLRTDNAAPSVVSLRAHDAAAIRRVPASSVFLKERIPVDSSALHLQTLILDNSGSQPVLQPQFSMSFAYCIVQLDRHWYSGDLLANDRWYIPGQHAGDYASGPAPATATPADSTATVRPAANTGFLSWIPVAFVAIKDVSVKLTGGALDPALTHSVTAFGPFSFAPDSSVSGLSNPGIEIIAWICSAQPVIPPQSDPSLPVSSPPPSSASSTADAANQNAAVV